MTALVEVRDLSVEYETAGYRVSAFGPLDLDAEPGELVVLLGPSGSGKTSLLSCLAGILTPTTGTIRLDGVEVTSLRGRDLDRFRRRSVGVVFQDFNLIASLDARRNVEVPLRLARQPWSVAKRRATSLLDAVGLSDRAHHRPAHLSGGEKQRVAIARALALDPPMLIADEPTAHLDAVQAERTIRLLRRIAAADRVAIIATHDERLTPHADRVIDLSAAQIAEGGRHRALVDGETVFLRGERSDVVYIVESGEIALFEPDGNGGEEMRSIIRAGGYFGELGPLLGVPRPESARAVGEARVTSYRVNEFRQRARHHPTGARTENGR